MKNYYKNVICGISCIVLAFPDNTKEKYRILTWRPVVAISEYPRLLGTYLYFCYNMEIQAAPAIWVIKYSQNFQLLRGRRYHNN